MSTFKVKPPRKGWLGEKKLLGAVKAGRPEALARFCRQQAAPLARLARALEPDGPSASDLLDRVLVRALKTHGARQEEIRLDEWLASVLVAECYRRSRAAPGIDAGRPKRGRHPRGRPGSAPPPTFHGWRQAAEDPARRDQAARWLMEAAASLPDALRVSWILGDRMKWEAASMGRILELGPQAAVSRLHRARLALLTSLCPARRGRKPAAAPFKIPGLDCTEMTAFLALDEESQDEEAAQVLDHRSRCPECARQAASYRLLAEMAGRLPQESPPEDLSSRLDRARQEAAGPESGEEDDENGPAAASGPAGEGVSAGSG